MSNSVFYKYFLGISLLTAILIFAICQFPLLKPHFAFSLISLGFFMLLTIAMHFFGKNTAKSKNKSLFTGVIMGSTFGKLAFSLILIIAYSKFGKPESNIFALPFFIIYLIFTIFETYVMMKISKSK